MSNLFSIVIQVMIQNRAESEHCLFICGNCPQSDICNTQREDGQQTQGQNVLPQVPMRFIGDALAVHVDVSCCGGTVNNTLRT